MQVNLVRLAKIVFVLPQLSCFGKHCFLFLVGLRLYRWKDRMHIKVILAFRAAAIFYLQEVV